MSRQQAWKELVPLLPHEPDLTKTEDREWAQTYLSLLLAKNFANLKDVTEEELAQARRFCLLHFWSEQYRIDKWGCAKMTQILGRDVSSVTATIRQASDEELADIQAWMLTGKLPVAEEKEAA